MMHRRDRGVGVVACTVGLALLSAMSCFMLVVNRSLAVGRVDAWFVHDCQAEETAHSAFDEAVTVLVAEPELDPALTAEAAYERHIDPRLTRAMLAPEMQMTVSQVRVVRESYQAETPQTVGLPTELLHLVPTVRTPKWGSGLLRFEVKVGIGRATRTYSSSRMFTVITGGGAATDTSGLSVMAQNQFWERRS